MPNKKSFFWLSIVEPQPIFEGEALNMSAKWAECQIYLSISELQPNFDDASPQHECRASGGSAFYALTDFLLSKTKTAPTLTKREQKINV